MLALRVEDGEAGEDLARGLVLAAVDEELRADGDHAVPHPRRGRLRGEALDGVPHGAHHVEAVEAVGHALARAAAEEVDLVADGGGRREGEPPRRHAAPDELLPARALEIEAAEVVEGRPRGVALAAVQVEPVAGERGGAAGPRRGRLARHLGRVEPGEQRVVRSEQCVGSGQWVGECCLGRSALGAISIGGRSRSHV